MSKRVLILATVGVIAALAFYGVASARHGVLVAKNMTGEQEISSEGEPGAGDEDGRGSARIRLKPEEDRVCFRLRWTNIAAPTASHIHEGPRGSNGPIVVGLFMSDNPLPDTISSVGGCASDVDDELSDRIRSNPRAFYVNIHNQDFPGGAIRNQLRHPRRR